MNLGVEYLDTLVSHRPLISFDGFCDFNAYCITKRGKTLPHFDASTFSVAKEGLQGLREKVERSFDEALADRGDATLSSRESVESRMPRWSWQPCFGWNDLRMNT